MKFNIEVFEENPYSSTLIGFHWWGNEITFRTADGLVHVVPNPYSQIQGNVNQSQGGSDETLLKAIAIAQDPTIAINFFGKGE